MGPRVRRAVLRKAVSTPGFSLTRGLLALLARLKSDVRAQENAPRSLGKCQTGAGHLWANDRENPCGLFRFLPKNAYLPHEEQVGAAQAAPHDVQLVAQQEPQPPRR